ncbi:hypothetical protein ACIBU0_35905 [Streptomyces sp. NPDC049627]|uniref:hypothetical protein n=1 Tax=Streptomyces sp. NPDC049627 TaxID=3365595 RepID=UPI0037B8351B
MCELGFKAGQLAPIAQISALARRRTLHLNSSRMFGAMVKGPPFLEASFASASVMRLEDGAWMLTGRSRADWTASGAEMAHSARTVMLFTSPGGTITGATGRRVFADRLTAAAGDADPNQGVVFHEEKSGDYLLRITRARRDPRVDARLWQGPHRPRPARRTDRRSAHRRLLR